MESHIQAKSLGVEGAMLPSPSLSGSKTVSDLLWLLLMQLFANGISQIGGAATLRLELAR